jgi:hypothetical protein
MSRPENSLHFLMINPVSGQDIATCQRGTGAQTQGLAPHTGGGGGGLQGESYLFKIIPSEYFVLKVFFKLVA